MKWMKPEDVRTPVTAEEAQAALDLIDIAMDRLEKLIPIRESRGETVEWLRALTEQWEVKRAEVAYAMERLDAGEMPLSVELARLRAQIDELTAKNNELQKSVREHKQQIYGLQEARVSVRPARERHIAEVERQNADLIAKNRRLAAALEDQRPAPVPSDDVKRALKKSTHDAFAFGAEALDELVAAGVELTPLAALFLDHCNNSLPRGFRIEWQAKDLTFKRAAADARAQRVAS